MIKGIDISKHQAGLKLADVKKAGYDFVILRGAYSSFSAQRTKQKDICFDDFYNQAKKENLLVGCYYYSTAKTRSEGEQEAIFLFNNCLKSKTFEMPIYIDVEDSRWQANDKKGVTDAILGFSDYLEQRGYYVGVYSSLSWFGSKFDVDAINHLTKWVARWGQSANNKPKVNFSAFDLWQYSANGKISGKTVDTDICYIDFERIIKQKALNGFSSIIEPTIPHNANEKTHTEAKPKTYTVQKGDTLTKIARQFNTTIAELVAKNKIKNPNKIYVGQVLKI